MVGSKTFRDCGLNARWLVGLLVLALGLHGLAGAAGQCQKPVYLTFDTGHMGVADLIAQTLKEKNVVATFFVANEKAKEGESSLADAWAPFWRKLAGQGHAFGSHTFDHTVWRSDALGGGFWMVPTAGPQAGRRQLMDAQGYCAQLARARDRIETLTGVKALPLFRAPGGKTSLQLLAAAKSCGFQHVPWSRAGFLGDELPSDRYPNAVLLRNALRDIQAGDILLAHLGIWSRQDPWAPAVLPALIDGLKAKGLCFETLAQHPQYRVGMAQRS